MWAMVGYGELMKAIYGELWKAMECYGEIWWAKGDGKSTILAEILAKTSINKNHLMSVWCSEN